MSNDADAAIRRHVASLLDGREAHETFERIFASFPEEQHGVRPEGFDHTAWRLLEHLRIAQQDILEFSRDEGWVSPEFPAGYWPPDDAPASAAAWDESVAAFAADLAAMRILRDTFDPTLACNPGKIFPTTRFCVESDPKARGYDRVSFES